MFNFFLVSFLPHILHQSPNQQLPSKGEARRKHSIFWCGVHDTRKRNCKKCRYNSIISSLNLGPLFNTTCLNSPGKVSISSFVVQDYSKTSSFFHSVRLVTKDYAKTISIIFISWFKIVAFRKINLGNFIMFSPRSFRHVTDSVKRSFFCRTPHSRKLPKVTHNGIQRNIS